MSRNFSGSTPQEYNAFQRLSEGLQTAQSACLQVAALRPDQRQGWEKIAEVLGVVTESMWRLAAERATKQ